MHRVLFASTLLALGCGSSARPADIPPVAPDFARGGAEGDALVAFGDDDDYDYDDDEGFGAFGASTDAAFDAANADAPEGNDPAEEHEDASTQPEADP